MKTGMTYSEEKFRASAGCLDEEDDALHSEAAECFTPISKRKATEINDQTLNT